MRTVTVGGGYGIGGVGAGSSSVTAGAVGVGAVGDGVMSGLTVPTGGTDAHDASSSAASNAATDVVKLSAPRRMSYPLFCVIAAVAPTVKVL
jgi:hypothetical protein